MIQNRLRIFATDLAILTTICFAPAAIVAEPFPELDCLVEPNVVVDVGSPEHGVVKDIAVDRSDTVSADDVLARLESSEQAANVRKARARANMGAEVNARKATLEFAQRKQERMRDLYASDAISSQQRDEVETELKMAQMQLQQARDASSLARIELDRAVGDLDRRTIRSPISGVVVERFVAPGEYVNEKPLLRVAQLHPLRVETVAPASMFGKIKTGMRAQVVSETLAGQVLDAEVIIVDRMIDPASATFGVRLELPNPDYAIPSGLNCRLRIDPNMVKTAATKPVVQPPKAVQATPVATPQKKLAPVTMAKRAASKTTQECRSFGPFSSEQKLDAMIAALGSDASEIDRRQVPDDKETGYIVMTRPLATSNEVKALADSIRKRGVTDLAVMRSAKYKGRISLGLFTAKHNAVERIDKLQKLGIDAELVTKHSESLSYWSDIQLSVAAIEQARWDSVAPDLMVNDCAPSSYVAAQSTDGP